MLASHIKNIFITFIVSFSLLTSFTAEAAKAPVKTQGKASTAAKGSLIIDSTSSGAEVYIDGKMSGTIPFKPQSISVGKHKIVVKKIGFLDYTNDVTITAGKGTRLTVELLPVATVVNIASVPANATVLVNGTNKGSTPIKIELKTGTYNIEIKLKDYLPFKKQIKITKLGEVIPVSATLTQDKLKKDVSDDDLDALLALPLDLPPDNNTGADPLALELEPLPDELPLEAPPADDPLADPLSLEPLALEPVDNAAPASKPTATQAPIINNVSTDANTDADYKTLIAVPAGAFTAAGTTNTATTKAQKDNKWYKSWWFWTITGVVVAGAAVGIGVGVSADQAKAIHFDGSWVLGGNWSPAQH